VAVSASLAFAEDFKTTDGKEYKNAKVSRLEPDGIVLMTKSGISKVYFTELPKEVQERFHYDALQAAQFTSQTLEESRLAQQQHAAEAQKISEQKAAKRELQRQQQETELQRQQQEAKMQRQQQESEQQQVQTGMEPTYSRSQEGIPEHTYQITQDHTIVVADGLRIRLKRGEEYHGRILVDHAEIDRDGRSYKVPSGILRQQQDSLQREPRHVQTETKPTYSRSQEGIPEHTYELLQDYTIDFGGVRIRLRRGEQYRGRILVDHAEIDRDGRSYNVPSGILWPKD
jgi:DNA polymerase III alpha subunit (gram-positive type)